MNTLARVKDGFRADGIISTFTFDGAAQPFMATLEHAWPQIDGSFKPIIQPGTYKCVRGVHALHDGVQFETFEITGVEGHSKLLFHAGNFNRDSEGCVLCGQTATTVNGVDMVTGSRAEFAAFMAELEGVSEFDLVVVNPE